MKHLNFLIRLYFLMPYPHPDYYHYCASRNDFLKQLLPFGSLTLLMLFHDTHHLKFRVFSFWLHLRVLDFWHLSYSLLLMRKLAFLTTLNYLKIDSKQEEYQAKPFYYFATGLILKYLKASSVSV